MSKKLKYIYWFAYYNLDSPSVRYRAKFPLDFAKKHLGIDSTLVIPGYDAERLLTFIKAYISALLFPKKHSIIVIQRVQSKFIYSNFLKLLVLIRKSITVYDLDDADYLERPPKTIHWFAKKCQYISAGSHEITDYMKQFNDKVLHVTSPVFDLQLIKQSRNKQFTIGWIGGFQWGHKESLYKLVFPAIKTLPFPCTFTLIGVTDHKNQLEIKTYFKDSKRITIDLPQIADWKDENVLQNQLNQFDLGIATLSDTPIHRAKSGIKAKQYMNHGIPVLCNNLPENNNVIVDGHNGFICNTAQAFRTKMIQIREMPLEEYQVLSQNARQSILNFNHYKYFEDLKTLINQEK